MTTRINPRSRLVTYFDIVVGEVQMVPGGWVYRHFKFNMKPSSALPTLEALLPNIDAYLSKVYGCKPPA